jgi:hypothetical protein
MHRESFRTAFLVALLVVPALGAHAYLNDTAIHTPPNYYTFTPPGVGGSYTDPVFRTSIKRLSDAPHMTNNAGSGMLSLVTAEYSTMSPFNKGNTRFILQHDSYFALYDGNGRYIKDLPYDVYASTEPRWSRSDPALLYYVNGNTLKMLNVESGASGVVHTFTEYGAVSGHGESDICFDGNHFVLVGDDRYVFVYEISTGTKGGVLDTAGHGFDSVYITPNDNVTVTWLQAGSGRYMGIELFNRNMAFQRQVTRAGGHMDVTRDTDGSEVLIWTSAADPAPVCNGSAIVKVRLADAHQTCLFSIDWGIGLHISAPDGNGWFVMETYDPADPQSPGGWKPFVNEVLQISTDGTQVRRLFHHRSRPFDSYYYMPRASVSRDGSRLIYSSNYGLQQILGYPNLYVDSYLVSLSGGSIGGGTPSPAPGGTQPPAHPPAQPPAQPPTQPPAGPSAGSWSRVEQNSSKLSYDGSWSPNSLAAHSGGSATLSMGAGSKATFSFTGTRARWIGYKDQWSGMAKVYVDGALAGTVNTYVSGARAKSVLFTSAPLAPGHHTLSVRVEGAHSGGSSGDWVWVDAFDYRP